ncbi:hypothetical protein LRAMOSA04516 [Lichtheimia ramosa]|uniref:Uncharacterized protein n=1 Tax=Lichtheimia ramosa TaxID=688394 RepID=A0A077WXE7_9FUNG|nr:hypothetical protein LRAMOSA04516 [Lichtheimia ramosa]
MSGQNFIGSKISLISNSDIRYVGTLHSLNAEESTVALEQVRSFGTEGRRGRPDEEIPASENVFEFVVFRGSDIKDLQVFEAPAKPAPPPPPANIPNDPAIMQSSMMKGYGGGMNPYMMPPSYPPMQQPHQYWGSPMYPMPTPMGAAGAPPHMQQPPSTTAPGQQQQQQQQQTMSSPARTSLAHPSAIPTTSNDLNKPATPMAPVSTSTVSSATTGISRDAVVDDLKKADAAVDRLANNLKDLEVEKKAKPATVDDEQRQQQQQQQNRNRRHYNNNNGNVNNNAARTRGGRHDHANKATIDIPKSDFDFESSNAKFNKNEIVKEVSGKDGNDQAEDQVEEQQEDEVVIPPPNDESFYDKQKSFFDNISCESKERSEQNGSFDRRAKFQEERKLNLETFGEVSVDHPRFRNYRGRGGFRGRGRGHTRGYRGNRGGAKSMA